MVVAEEKIIGILLVLIGILTVILGILFSGIFDPNISGIFAPLACIFTDVIGILVIIVGILFYRKE